MVLQKQKIGLNFSKGMDQSVDEKQLQTSFASLQNVTQTKTGMIEKRLGYVESGKFENATQIFSLNNELIINQNNNLISYSTESKISTILGKFYNIQIDETKLLASQVSVSKIQSIAYKNMKAISYLGSDGYSYISILDSNDKMIISPIKKYQSTKETKIVGCSNFIYFFTYGPSNNIFIEQYSIFNPSVLANPVLEITDAGSVFDVCVVNDIPILAYVKLSTTYLKIASITRSNVIGSPSQAQPYPIEISDVPNATHIAISDCAADNFIIIARSAVSTYYYQYNSSFQQIDSYDFGAIATLNALSVFYKSTTNTVYIMVDKTNNLFTKITFTLGSPGTASSIALYGGKMQSKICQIGDDIAILVTSEISSLQNTYILCDIDNLNTYNTFHVIAKFSTGYAVNNTALVSISNMQVALPIIQNDFNSISYFTLLENKPINSVQVKDILYIAGSILNKYDGVNINELSFLSYPVVVSTSQTSGNIAIGTYLYKVVWESVDNSGNVERSAPSEVTQVVVASTTKKITLNIKPLYFTNKKNVKAVIYRTLAGGTVYYRVGSLSSMPDNVVSSNITYDDNAVDASISSNPLIYTTGDILEPISIVSCSFVNIYHDRLIIGGSECGNRIYLSNRLEQGIQFEIPDIPVYLNFNPVAANQMDDKLIIFSDTQIAALSGDGPDKFGSNQFAQPYYLSTNKIGCISPLSILNLNSGLIFHSQRGIYVLDKGMNLQFIGLNVKDYKSYSIISSSHNEDKDEAYFYTNNKVVLVLNTLYQTWSVFTTIDIISASNNILLSDNGSILVPSNIYTDMGLNYKAKIETGWIALNGIHGLQRIYSLLLLGTYVGQHNLKISLCYDYQTYISETISVSVDSILSQKKYGEDTYGSDTFGGIENGVYEFDIRPTIQKCEAIKIIIEDMPTNENTFTLSTVSIVAGIKPNNAKLAQKKILGSR